MAAPTIALPIVFVAILFILCASAARIRRAGCTNKWRCVLYLLSLIRTLILLPWQPLPNSSRSTNDWLMRHPSADVPDGRSSALSHLDGVQVDREEREGVEV